MEQLAKNVWKLNLDSNIYLLTFDQNIVIDTGPRAYSAPLKKEISNVIDPLKVDMVIFTHLHYDHIGNFNLFKNAKFFASKEEIDYYMKNPLNSVGDPNLLREFDVNLIPFLGTKELTAILTPGHTIGSMCIFDKKEGILFSGDTLFFKGMHGRTDLPNSIPEKMGESLAALRELDYKILAPGHDY